MTVDGTVWTNLETRNPASPGLGLHSVLKAEEATTMVVDVALSADAKETSEAVLVTGITGYIATETTKALIDEGWKHVRGTSRSSPEQATEYLARLVKYAQARGCTVEFVQADLMDKESLRKAVASPFSAGGAKDIPIT